MRTHSALLLTLAALPLAALTTSQGQIRGQVRDAKGQPVTGALVSLHAPATRLRIGARTDREGRFTLPNLPPDSYHLEVEAPGFDTLHQEVEVRSSLPVPVDLRLTPKGATVVVEERLTLVEDHPSTHLDIGKATLERLPTGSQGKALEAALLTTPGFIADENGRFHFRGSHGQATYVIDGIPVSDQLHATFSNSLDPAQVESLEVITGGISAEYGGKPVAVINLTTRSGLGTPGGFAGEVSQSLGRFHSTETTAGLRGGTDSFGWFVAGAHSRSDRFLDPVVFENLHNHGASSRLSSRMDWVASDTDSFRFSFSGGRTDRQVANLPSQEAAGRNVKAVTADLNLNLAWSHLFSDTLNLDAAVYHRRSTATLDPTRDLPEGFTAGGPDTPDWVRQDRSLENWGAQVALTRRFGEGSTLKGGFQTVAFPLREHFDFAHPGGEPLDPSDAFYPFTPAGGGHRFTFRDELTPVLASAFAQADLHLGQVFVAAGLRYDHYRLRGATDAQVQPRLGISWTPLSGTVLRASYDRLLVLREHENLALSTSQQAWDLGPQAGTPVPALRAERQDSFSYGVEQQAGKFLRVMVEYWEKRSENAGDNEQFRDTGILFPVGAARGIFRGANARLELIPAEGFSGFLSLGRTRALFEAPLVGGLQLEAPEAGPGERFLIDHDQKLSAQLGLGYERDGLSIQLTGRHDSGLVAGDPADAAGNPDLAEGVPYVRKDGEGTWRVKPHTTWNLGVSRTFTLSGPRRLTLGADLLNATNTRGLYNFMSTFGGTHVLPPRTWSLRVRYAF